MHRSLTIALRCVALIAALVACPMAAAQEGTGGTAVLLEVTGPIGPATSDYVRRGLNSASGRGAALVILRIDTPGGLDTSMREIIEDILATPLPVVGFVAPSGARAASAGTYILYACHIAAMAPGTNLGAATPVQMGGGSPFDWPSEEEGEEPAAGDSGSEEGETADAGGDGAVDDAPSRSFRPTLDDKAINDAVAYIRSLAQLRGRNEEWAARAVSEAASLPARDARDRNVIDLIATDVDDLLAGIDGRTVEIDGEPRTLSTAGMTVTPIEPDWRTRFLSIITNPNVAYILMLIGLYGLILEFYSPGFVLPGVIGAISLLLALYSFHVLPIDYTGAALILLGLALIAAELFAPGLGALGIGGVAAFVIGSVMLIDTEAPGFAVSWQVIGPVAALGGAALLGTGYLFMQARRRPVVSGREEMVGSAGQVVEWAGTEGRIRVHGEIWRARAAPLPTAGGVAPGHAVRVVAIDGLVLTVEPGMSDEAGDG